MTDREHISRRELLRGRFLGGLLNGARETVASAITPLVPDQTQTPPAPDHGGRFGRSFPVLRPPGAVDEDAFLDGCTKCDACIQACPHDAIVPAPPRFRRAAGTPMIDPLRKPCMMCDDFPCISACEPNVLRMSQSKRMGEAQIDTITCLAHSGSFCTVCSEHCPVAGAIEVVNGKPRIIQANCTGCGVCQHVCPAPHNAILLMPLASRPTPATLPPRDAGANHDD